MSSDYIKKTLSLLKKIQLKNNTEIINSAKFFFDSYKNNGLVYIFGTGHSHLLSIDGHYRAGGFAAICPILDERIMLHKDAIGGSKLERSSGLAKKILKKYSLKSSDTFVIFTNSGVNLAPIEAAIFAKEKNCKVIGVSSLHYAKIAPLSKIGKRLKEVVDIHIDNCGPPGDALIKIKNGVKVSAFSTIGGSFILNSIINETAKLAKNEKIFPFYISSNMPNAKKHNQKLFKKYKKLNPHL